MGTTIFKVYIKLNGTYVLMTRVEDQVSRSPQSLREELETITEHSVMVVKTGIIHKC